MSDLDKKARDRAMKTTEQKLTSKDKSTLKSDMDERQGVMEQVKVNDLAQGRGLKLQESLEQENAKDKGYNMDHESLRPEYQERRKRGFMRLMEMLGD